MYHAVYPQMVYTINPQEAGMPGSSIPLYNGMQFLSLSNSQDNCHFFNNSFNMSGATMARHRAPSPVYGQNNTAPNQGDILKNQQQTNVLAISNSNNIVPSSNSIQKNHVHTNAGNNQYNPEIMPSFDQSSQRAHQNYNGMNKQSGKNKEKKNGTHNRQNGCNTTNNKNNHKHQTYTVYNNSDKQQNQNKHQNGTKKLENQNNNYQQHNRNNFNNGFRKNLGWQNKQRNQNKNIQSIGSVSSNSSSSSTRMSPVSPSLTEIQTNSKKDPEESFYHTNIQNTPRKSPTLGEYMFQTLLAKDRDEKHCSKSLPIKFSNLNISKEDFPMVAINNCIINESWPDHYSFSNHQPYYHHRFNHQLTGTFNNQQFVNSCNSQNRKRDNKSNKSLLSLRDHRFGACYQRTRRFHIALAKGHKTNDDTLKPIGHSIPYSLHNLYELHIYYNLTPFENIPFYSQNFFVPADRFIAKALVSNNADKINLSKNDSLFGSDKLSKSIWAKYLLVQQSNDTYISKLMLWKYLFLFIKNFHARYSLFLVGSTMTGFASNSSDVDFCLIVKNSEIDQRNEAHLHLDNLYKLITINAADYFYDVRLFPAKVPILRFHDCAQELDVDLNCNNFVGIRNTHLLHCYSQLNWKVKPLVIIVKQWARANQMNSARESTISSYSLTLMVIHYLQCGVQPPILPCLHNMFPGKFENYSDIHSIDIHEKMEPYKTDNKMSLGELLLGFFDYYSTFDYPSYAISVRKANVIKVENCKHEPMPKNDPTQWMYICIEEPFDRTNTARSVYLYNMFLYIKQVFQLSHLKLKQTHDLERVMNLGLRIPEIRSTSPSPKGPSALKTEYRWPNKYKNILDNEISQQRKIELAGC